jgi:predicted 2-oxoglutarate/Fe(II)-dependent dioxygenase YbiX
MGEEEAMSGITQDLASLLSTVTRPGDFYAYGKTEWLAPRLEVKDVGTVALPLLGVQAEQLIAVAQRAPYGRGSKTIVDANVRRTWQIAPDAVSLSGKHWSSTLERIVALAAEALGVSEPVTAELYKLLIYDTGSFFVSHRDTEKSPGMFATLVLALPSQSTGGELIVRHKEREVRLDLASDEFSEITYAAFYADCVHEVLPVTQGYRATLVYNLIRKGKGDVPKPPGYDGETTQAALLLSQWAHGKASPDPDTPVKVIYPLEHAYSPAELDFAKLKGVDAAVAGVLKTAAEQAECDLHLALISIEESGSAEHTGSYRRRRSRYSDDDDDSGEFMVGEVFDRSETLTKWCRPDGQPTTLGAIEIEDGEVSPPDALEDMEPDEEHFHEATGNEGASFERTYHRAALVLWPRSRRLAVLNQAGQRATLPYLESLAARWTNEGATPGSKIWAEAHELSGHMLATWNDDHWYELEDDDQDYDDEDSDIDGDDNAEVDDDVGDALDDARGKRRSAIARLLMALAELGDKVRIEQAFDLLTGRRGQDTADLDPIVAAAVVFPLERGAQLIEKVVVAQAGTAVSSCCGLLATAVAGPFASAPKLLATAARRLLAALPGDPARPSVDQWGRPEHVRPGAAAVTDLIGLTEAIDPTLAAQLSEHVLAWPQTYDIDDAVVPAVKQLMPSAGTKPGPVMKRLHAACLAHLEARAAEPLDAPKDWSRPSGITCTCVHCKTLAGFLANSAMEVWTLKAAEAIRRHVEYEIRSARADVDCRTERKGSPHGLVCKKNLASYERRVVQRKQDLADITFLNASNA